MIKYLFVLAVVVIVMQPLVEKAGTSIAQIEHLQNRLIELSDRAIHDRYLSSRMTQPPAQPPAPALNNLRAALGNPS